MVLLLGSKEALKKKLKEKKNRKGQEKKQKRRIVMFFAGSLVKLTCPNKGVLQRAIH